MTTAMQVRDSTCTDPDLQRRWLALLHSPGLGNRGILRLLGEGKSTAGTDPTPPPIPTGSAPDRLRIEQDLAWLGQPGHHLLTLGDSAYPELLKQTVDPPAMLFLHGDPDLLTTPQLAVVGSRNPTPSGRESARDFSAFLARSGITITSGLASGIDGSAHAGALDADGRTVAVAGTGLDRVYPSAHRELAHRIANNGLIVSEFPTGTPAARANFPRRNRVISGLSLGTLVVEAAQRSGSLITARLAAEQGREVFAIPGSIHNPLARGCHALIRQGAKLVETAEDILEELAPLLGSLVQIPARDRAKPQQCTTETPLPDPEYRQLMAAIGHDPVPVDLIIQRSGLTAESVSSMLLLLELDGHVTSMPGGRYCLSGKSTAEFRPSVTDEGS